MLIVSTLISHVNVSCYVVFSISRCKKSSQINPKQKSSGIHSIHIIFGTVRIFCYSTHLLVRYAFIVRNINGQTSLLRGRVYYVKHFLFREFQFKTFRLL